MRKAIVSERPTVRLDEKSRRQAQELIDLYQENSINRISVADIVKHALDTLHEIKFPEKEEHN